MPKIILKRFSIVCFVLIIPLLTITDWYYKGFGIVVATAVFTLGIIFDQISRIIYPKNKVDDYSNFKSNKLLKLIALILFIQTPLIVIFLNRVQNNLGLYIAIIFIVIGLVLDQIARNRYPYKIHVGGNKQ